MTAPCIRAVWRGVTVCAHSIPKYDAWAAGSGQAVLIDPIQGSFTTGNAQSANTHAGGGAIDVELDGYSLTEASTTETAGRTAGLLTWARIWDGNHHIHGLDPDCPDLSPAACDQFESFRAGHDGLAARGKDTGSRTHAAAILAAFDNRKKATVSTAYGYKYETSKTAKHFTNTQRTVKGITIHWWGSDGASFDGIVNWFCAPTTTAQTSAHYVAQGADANSVENRRVACIVDPDVIAWHAGDWNANVSNIGIECRPEARAVDYDVVAELVARLWMTYGVVPLYPHKHWTSTSCPGRWDVEKVRTLAVVKYEALKSGGTTSPSKPTTPTTTTPAPPTTTSKDWSDMATKAEIEAVVESVVKRYLGDVLTPPSRSTPEQLKANSAWSLDTYVRNIDDHAYEAHRLAGEALKAIQALAAKS